MKKNIHKFFSALALTGVVCLSSSIIVKAQEALPVPVTTAAPAAETAPANPVAGTMPPAPAAAPAAPVALSADETALLATADAKRSVRDGSLMPDDNFPTLFFSAWQHALLQEAKVGFNTRLPEGPLGSGADQPKKDPGLREVSLGGIAFANTSKWTVWLNGVRVTPDAIPQQVLDIKVSAAYIDLKWFDNYTDRIYPIRLRPQERFNLDTRIFLPGAGIEGAM